MLSVENEMALADDSDELPLKSRCIAPELIFYALIIPLYDTNANALESGEKVIIPKSELRYLSKVWSTVFELVFYSLTILF